VAIALVELEKQIPGDIAWVLRVDGPTDLRRSPAACSGRTGSVGRARHRGWCNIWSARACRRSIWSRGFGEFQPIDVAATEDAYKPQPAHRVQADRTVNAKPFTLRPYSAADEDAAMELWRRTWRSITASRFQHASL